MDIAVTVPDELVERIARRVLELLDERGDDRDEPSPFMSVPEAALFLRTTRQAVDDLLRRRKLTRHKRGRCVLVARAEVEALVHPEDPDR
jgi:excisionase family DNA binding protein